LSAICFNQQKNIFIDNLLSQYKNYFTEIPTPTEGDVTQSIIYVPINSKDKHIGVISVQSFENYAYNEFHINILENIAIYTAIALENADAYQQINAQKEIIEEQNEHIKGSIIYAQTIQNAILPTQEFMRQYFDSFIIYRPKDIVSGDFYWFSVLEVENKTYYFAAVIDCTGHGVPGAFMSMIGYQLLREVINEKHIVEPHEILMKINDGIRTSLSQETTQNNDGMDLLICRIEKLENQNTQVIYAGAKRPLFYVNPENQKTQIIKGGRKTIGGRESLRQVPYESSVLMFEQNTILFLASDGYSDQNNEDREKFGREKMLKMFDQNQNLSILQQKQVYDDAIVKWMQNTTQRDDITLMAIKL